MATGIHITNSRNINIGRSKISGMDIGVEVYDSENVTVTDVHCETRTAVSGARVKGLKVVNLTHDDRSWINHPTLLAVLVRRAAHGNV